MKNKIQEVHDYFKNKIINGDYIYDSLSGNFKSVVTVLIDDFYRFDFWVANGVEHFCVKGLFAESFMAITLTNEEREVAYNNLIEPIRQAQAQTERQEKLETYEKLKKEFEGSC